MCVNGVNSAQLKLVIHQLIQQVELNGKELEQWAHLLEHLNSEEIVSKLKEAQESLGETVSSLGKVLKGIDEFSQEKEITISF